MEIKNPKKALQNFLNINLTQINSCPKCNAASLHKKKTNLYDEEKHVFSCIVACPKISKISSCMQSISKSKVACHPNFHTLSHKPQQVSPLFYTAVPSNKAPEPHGNSTPQDEDSEQPFSTIMESLIRQTRSRFAGSKEDRSSSSSTADRKIPPQKSQSFREKKNSQGWTKKQLSRQMSWEYDFISTEYPTAVAAAAYAIQSLEESNSLAKKERAYGTDKSLSKTKSRVDETEEKTEPLKSALKSSDGTPRSSFKDDGSTSMSRRLPDKKPTRKISFADMDEVSNNGAEKLPLQKAPSLKRPPSFEEKQLNMAALPKPEHPPTRTQPVQSDRKPGPGDSAADAWEKEEMTSIKERFEKLRATIDDWEAKKKKKERRKSERTEAELDKRKSKAFRKYNSEMARIETIAGGARSQAEENRRKEEMKVKEKANKIRATGKIPATCLCF